MPFEVTPQPLPIITSIAPALERAGATIAITGTFLDGTYEVTVNEAMAAVTSVSETNVEFVIPTGASTGPVVLKTPAGEASTYLTVIPPVSNAATSYPLTISNNGQTLINLPAPVTNAAKTGVYLNTTRQRYGVDWTASGSVLTWISTDLTLATTDKLEILI